MRLPVTRTKPKEKHQLQHCAVCSYIYFQMSDINAQNFTGIKIKSKELYTESQKKDNKCNKPTVTG